MLQPNDSICQMSCIETVRGTTSVFIRRIIITICSVVFIRIDIQLTFHSLRITILH